MEETNREIYRRLKRNRSLDGLGLQQFQGRWLISCLDAPCPESADDSFMFGTLQYSKVKGTDILRNMNWEKLQFSACNFSHLALFAAKMVDCLFVNCRCQDLGFWDTSVSECEFINCDFREAAFGGIDIDKPRPNRFKNVTFQNCDFRTSSHSCETFEGCAFLNCRLERIDFEAAVFSDCYFEGTLRDVMFKRKVGYCGGAENKLARCDFRQAELIDCSFVQIDLNPSMFPANEDIIVLWHGPEDWKEWGLRIGAANDRGTALMIDHLIRESGRPSITTRSFLDGFTDEQVRLLVSISGTSLE